MSAKGPASTLRVCPTSQLSNANARSRVDSTPDFVAVIDAMKLVLEVIRNFYLQNTSVFHRVLRGGTLPKA